MVVPAGAPSVRRGRCASAPRSTTRSRALLARARALDRRRRRGRLRARPRRPARPRSRRSSRPPSARATATSVAIALDPATSELYRDGAYRFEGRETLDGAGMIDFWAELVDRFPIVSIEDGLAEDDWDGLADADRAARRPRAARRRRPLRHERRASCGAGSTQGSRNAILVKVNQIGTLTETLDAIALAQRARLRGRDLAPLGRDRGRDDRRPRRRARTRPDQDRRAGPLRPRRQVQPAAADRGGARRPRPSIPGWGAFPVRPR